jgi:hypothetical protein
MNTFQKESFIHEIPLNKMQVIVTSPNSIARKVRVLSSDPISILFKFLPSGNKTVFYQGEIINSSSSFQNYGILDLDRIAILNHDQISFDTEEFWKKATKRDIDNKGIWVTSQEPFLKREISRHQDLCFQKIENHYKSYQCFLKKFHFIINESHKNDHLTCTCWEKEESLLKRLFPHCGN